MNFDKFIRTLLRLFLSGRLTPKKCWNMLKIGRAKLLRVEKFNAYPTLIMIEPTSICNLKCPLCPTGAGKIVRPNGFLALDNFKNLIDETGDYLTHMMFWFSGEPLLNKDLFQMIRYARDKGIFCITSTNGHFMDRTENMDKILQCGLDTLIISLDGMTQETFAKFRVGGKLDIVLQNIEKLIRERKNANSPFIELQFIAMSHNEHEVDEFKKFARRINVNKFIVKSVGIWEEATPEEKAFLPKNPTYHRSGQVMKKFYTDFCERLWATTLITWDGVVTPCCYFHNHEHVFGNAFDGTSTFRNIWMGKEYQSFRKKVKQEKQSMAICRSCPGTTQSTYIEYDN